MKKQHLYLASALFTILLATGAAQAAGTQTPVDPTVHPKHAQQEMKMAGQPDKDVMPGMSPEKAQMMRETMMKMREDNKEVMDQMMARHKELAEIMKAETFDRSAYMDKMEEINVLRGKVSKGHADAMADMLEKMTPAERQAMPSMPMMGGMGKGGMGLGMKGPGMKGMDCPMMKDMKDMDHSKMAPKADKPAKPAKAKAPAAEKAEPVKE